MRFKHVLYFLFGDIALTRAYRQCFFGSSVERATCTGVLRHNMTAQERHFEPGDFICSKNKEFQFGLTNLGAISLCHNGEYIWSAMEGRKFQDVDVIANFAILQKGGNLVAYRWVESKSSFQVTWSTDTGNESGVSLLLSDDGILSFTNDSGEELWKIESYTNAPTTSSSPTFTNSSYPSFSPSEMFNETIFPTEYPSNYPTSIPTNKLSNMPSSSPSLVTESPSASLTVAPSLSPSNERLPAERFVCDFSTSLSNSCDSILTGSDFHGKRMLYAGEYLCSSNQKYKFGVTLVGELALCEDGYIVWRAADQEGNNAPIAGIAFALFQSGGDFALYKRPEIKGRLELVWSSDTGNNRGARMQLTDDGTVIISSNEGDSLWEIYAAT